MTIVKTVKVSDKGQIAIPLDIRQVAGIEKGDVLILSQDEGNILIQKANEIGKTMKDEFKDILKFSEQSLKEIWDNEEDEIWETYL